MRDINEIDVTLLDAKKIGASKSPKIHIKDIVKMDPKQEDINLLYQGERYFSDMRDFYRRRARNRNYLRGKQWDDPVTDPRTGQKITEAEYIKSQGKVPLKQNFIRSLAQNLSGQFQSYPRKSMVLANKRGDAKASEMLTNTLHYVHQVNNGDYLDARNFDEFMLSGLSVSKIGYRYNDELERPEICMENINPRRFCFNTDVSDPRLTDIRFVCEIMDLTIEDVINNFAKTKKQAEQLRDLFRNPETMQMYELDGLSPKNDDNLDFYTPYETNKCRIYEMWYKKTVYGLEIHDPVTGSYKFSTEITPEDIDAQNELRIMKAAENGITDVALIDYTHRHSSVWFYKYLTNLGYCIMEGESPYEHGQHPYAIHAYPMLDGEIWGKIEDIIDQQRYINRYITLVDFVISAGAKGVWLIPRSTIPDEWNEEDYKDELVRVGGAIVYKDDPRNVKDPKPIQVTSQSFPVGIQEMLAYQLKFIQDVSGVQPAIQGVSPKSGTAASLYAQEAQNAAMNVIDMMNAFAYYIKQRDRKVLKTIIQFYNEKRYLHISGSDYEKEAIEYDPDMVDDIDFDLTVSEGHDTPIYRRMVDEMLMQLLNMQAISVEMFLENTSYPFADKILESIRQNKEELEQGQQMSGISPELMSQVQAGANPEVMNILSQGMPDSLGT